MNHPAMNNPAGGLSNMGMLYWSMGDAWAASTRVASPTAIQSVNCMNLKEASERLACVIERQGGPKAGSPEAIQAPIDMMNISVWCDHIMRLSEEVSWRAGVSLPRPTIQTDVK